MGHLLPRLGMGSWAHSGVAKLYSSIAENGYQLLYLSSRPIGYAGVTKKYLRSVKQDGKCTLPDGPVLLSPDRTAKSLYREMIIKQPHLFKIECLLGVQTLFVGQATQPFFAGFGNRDTDLLTYKRLGIREGKIFIINPKGEINQKFIDERYRKSYPLISAMLDMIFPPLNPALQ
mmetsp:Transcript_15334/g.25917  ORF Transcript_15334/g.25917 Transcript_15334/m.25917 type:complete len:175 (+) Transcript_15334:838-1362(+)